MGDEGGGTISLDEGVGGTISLDDGVGGAISLDDGVGGTIALDDGVGVRGVEGDASDGRCFLNGVSPCPRGGLGPGNGAGGVSLSTGVVLVGVPPTRVSEYGEKRSSIGLF